MSEEIANQMKLNRSGEDYLKAMLVIKQEKGEVRSWEVAKYLKVTRPSVSNAVHFLKEGGFLTMDKNKRISLTEHGQRIAEQIYERHRVIKEALIYFGIEPEVAGQDACRLEHDLSEQSFDKLKEFWEKHKEMTT